MVKDMTDVQFDEQLPGKVHIEKQSLFSNLIISSGLAKDQAGAQIVLFIIALLAFALTTGMIVYGNSGGTASPEEINAEVLKG